MSTLRLKAARTPADTEPAKPPRRGRPVAQAPPARAPPPPKKRGWPRQVTFSLPPSKPPTTTSTSSTSGCPLRAARPPNWLNLWTCRRRVWGEPVVACHLFLLCFPPRPSRDLLFPTRVRPFRLNIFFAYKRNKAKLDPYRMCFACSLEKFCSIFSLLFASFRF